MCSVACSVASLLGCEQERTKRFADSGVPVIVDCCECTRLNAGIHEIVECAEESLDARRNRWMRSCSWLPADRSCAGCWMLLGIVRAAARCWMLWIVRAARGDVVGARIQDFHESFTNSRCDFFERQVSSYGL